MSNIFGELQSESNKMFNTVVENRQRMNRIVEIFQGLPTHATMQLYFSRLREGIRVETLEAADAFMVDPGYPMDIMPEELRHDSLGFCNAYGYVYAGRYVYPVKDSHGDVAGWCGYDKFITPKYLDSVNYGYKAKQGLLWGMELISLYYRSNLPVFITEGIVCAMWLRQEGFQALSLLGSYISPYIAEILRRFGKRCIIVPDSDAAGNKLMIQAKMLLPEAIVIQSRVAKDIDDSQKLCPKLADDLRSFYKPFGRSQYFTRR